ncbi:MAG: hypothetical protein ACOX8E_01905 [Ruminococcus sp.]|jgi:hypothetical protein
MEYFNRNAEEKYGDIIRRSRPCTEESRIKHPRMPSADRAKIFAPFSALKGYEDVIKNEQEEILLVPKSLLSEEEQENLSRKINTLKKGMQVQITFFRKAPSSPEDTPLGLYRTLSSQVAAIDSIGQLLIFEDCSIPFDDILELSLPDVSRL